MGEGVVLLPLRFKEDNTMAIKDTKTTETAPEKEKMVTIKLPRDREGKKGDQFVSVNERTWLIKRGVEVEVPECAAEVLRLSEMQEDATYERIESLKRD
jgi:hypothetical protein